MDMSLDDLIKSKKLVTAPSRKFGSKKLTSPNLRKPLNRPAFKDVQRVTDARLKIIEKNRAKIRDARDKLAEITRSNGDVRKKLLEKQHRSEKRDLHSNFKNMRIGERAAAGNGNVRKLLPSGGLRTKHSTTTGASGYRREATTFLLRDSRRSETVGIPPRGYVDYDNMEKIEEEEYAAASRLSRTVKNDIAYEVPPAAPRRLNSWGSSTTDHHYDPFDVYEVPHDTRRERRISPDLSPSKGLLTRGHSPDLYARRYIPEPSSHLSYEMRTRLERAPDPHASMGIFSNPLKPSSASTTASMTPNSSTYYRIVVSNLHTSVTHADIKELFEDIGDLYDSRIVRPGIAEVIYKSLSDAEKAVDTYHNRQLDGQPMKCLLVNPRVSNKPTAPAILSTSSLTSNKTPLEIDIDALHKVLFRRH
uniref:RRM domain-containing protein n=1 Tax=Glossina morsitans morsitans TaxID=37546 RepID=A0A1A9YUK2_GLOMM